MTERAFEHPDSAVAEVDLSAITHNLQVVRELAPGRKVLAAVKANAYGHGLVRVARHLEGAGVDWFGVATPEEALALRDAGIGGGVLLLGPLYDPVTISRLVARGVSLTVPGVEALECVADASLAEPARVQVVVDTGMGRIGCGPEHTAALARRVVDDPQLRLEGLWTHFASPEDADRTSADAQLARFREAVASVADAGIEVPLTHAASSAATATMPEAHFDMVRAGIVLYGYPASEHVRSLCPPLRPAMTLTAPVTFVKRVPAGTTISYNAMWRAPASTTIATVRYGYADGYPRVPTNTGFVGLRGQRCDVVGRVCMDQMMIDVGDMEGVRPGDRVTIFGEGGPDARELGAAFGTVSYQMLTSVGTRTERVYKE